MIYLPSTKVPVAARTWAELQNPKVSSSFEVAVAVAVDLTVPRVQTVVTMDRSQEPAPNCEVGGKCHRHDRSRLVGIACTYRRSSAVCSGAGRASCHGTGPYSTKPRTQSLV